MTQTPRGNILIVDDTPANLDVLTRFLADQGHKVRPAINGEIALKAAAKSPPDVILLDIQMPGMNGFEVCQRLKADETMREIPVIFISALDALEDKVRAFEVGGVDYITKPFQIMEVLARVESQLRIQWQRRRIEALSLFRDELVAIVSHDLKNPLNAVLGYSTLIQEDLRDGNPANPDLVDKIHGAGMMMLNMVRDLLDNARNEERLPMRFGQHGLQALVEEQMEAYELQAQRKRIALVRSYAQEDIVVTVDDRRFAQVVSNLISNAIKYSPENSTVTAHVWRENGAGMVAVEDNGFGIPPEDLPHIFEKFYRVNSQQHMAVEGTGLGLPIARMIVEQHGGTLTASSEPGRGSVFTIAVPVAG
jgi:two-component system, sensor histidine kinase and response regulator